MADRLASKIRQIFHDWLIAIAAIVLFVGGTVLATQFTGAETPEPVAASAPSGEQDANDVQNPSPQTSQNPAQRASAGAPAEQQSAQPTAAAPDQAQPAPAAESQPSQAAQPAQPSQPPSTAAHQHAHEAAPQPAANAATQTAQAPAPAAPAAQQAAPAPQAPGPQGAAAPQQAVAGDTRAGQLAFRKCQACHSLEPGKNLIGPSLSGVVGRAAGQAPGFNYSPAMKDSGVTWTPENLAAFLEAPQKFVPKNKMAFPGLKLASERENVIAFLQSSSSGQQPAPAAQQAPPAAGAPQTAQQQPAAAPAAQQPVSAARATPHTAQQEPAAATPVGDQPGAVGYVPSQRYTLRSGIAEGRMVYLGVGGAIDGQVNPILSAAEGQVVQITLLNGEGAEHDVVFPDMNAASPRIVGRGTSTVIVFRATKAGDFVYYCSVPGHRQAGMEGQFIVTPRQPEDVAAEADIAQLPTEVPEPIGDRAPETVRVDLTAVELEARLADGTTYGFWTFNGRVPGPMLRARVGDTLDVHVKNAEDSAFSHSVDFHAATGPGGGAVSTQVEPGHAKSFKFKALVPGLYVYHCATPMVAHHITNGMYGMILVEPEGGLAPVDHEFYVMQGEIYTQDAFGQHGRQEFSVEKLLDEDPEYFVFNGSVGALSKLHPLKAKVGETVRIFFGVGGPNFTSSFHVIGEIFDRVYAFADLQTPPLQGVQTITVPPGGAVVVEFKVDVPGNYILVDHALSRAERGLVGILQVEGNPNPEIYDGKIEEGSGH